MLEKSELIKFLVDKGADLNFQDSMGRTSIMIAVERENVKSVKELIFLGADQDILDYSGRSVHDYAKFSRKSEIRKLFK